MRVCVVAMPTNKGRDIVKAVEHSSVKVWILLYDGSILHGGSICSSAYFPFQPMIHNWSINGCGLWGKCI